jgi:hypothetical protein
MPGVRCALEAARRTLRVASCVSRTEGAHRGGSKSTAAARSALADLSIEDRRLGLRSATVPARMEHAAGIQLARNVPPRRIRRASRPALGLSARHGVCLPMLHAAWRMAHVVCGIAHVALLQRAVAWAPAPCSDRSREPLGAYVCRRRPCIARAVHGRRSSPRRLRNAAWAAGLRHSRPNPRRRRGAAQR